MPDGYRRVATSVEVWAVIRARHHDELVVFGSYSAPAGASHGDPDLGEMRTSYALRTSPIPLIEARTTWEIDRERPCERRDERHEYWLCHPTADGD